MTITFIGEIWFLRLLLFNRPGKSYKDIRTVHGIEYNTFQSAAVALGYVTDKLEGVRCFESALGHSTPAELRGSVS